MKKKILFALIACLFVCLLALTVSASNEVTLTSGEKADLEDVFKVQTKDGVVQITGFNSGYSKNDVTDVIFPDEIDGLEANFLFGEATSLKTITFEATDTFFISGDAIFSSCSVEKITFNPNCIVEIRKGNFSDCASLTEITFPKFRKLAGSAFKSCSNMVATNELVLAEGMTEIGGHAFNGCTSLSGTVVFPSTLEKIQEYSFQKTGFSEFDLSKCANLTLVGGGYGGPFTDNDNITKLDLSGCTSLTKLKNNFVSDSANLTEVILPPNLTEIPHKAFAHCYKLQSIVLPASVTYVADEAFHSARRNQDIKTFTVYLQGNTVFHEKYPFRDSGAKIEFVLIGEGMTAEAFIAANTFSGITGATVVDYKDSYDYTVGQTISSHTVVENYC
ncbi:MAG: leucine-rich repeat domain-containing protein, partial [Clostridia bacterium]|nr:leucine-rich repeat domain-containing protein [Clostridia bacterium]